MENLIGLWPNLSRAYEVALLGGFSISVVFNKDYINGFDDYKSIKSFYKNVSFEKDGDLIIDINKPRYTQCAIEYETLGDIIKRVSKARDNSQPDTFKGDSCNTLLNTATERLSLSHSKRQSVIEISRVIAQLDDSEVVDTHHLAEAIQYKCIDSNVCYAEEESISFGYGIVIKRTELYEQDINDAINYLRSLI